MFYYSAISAHKRNRWEGGRDGRKELGRHRLKSATTNVHSTVYTRTIRNGKLENPALRPLMFLVGTQQPVPSSALFCRCYKEATHCIGRSMEGKHLRRKSFFVTPHPSPPIQGQSWVDGRRELKRSSLFSSFPPNKLERESSPFLLCTSPHTRCTQWLLLGQKK